MKVRTNEQKSNLRVRLITCRNNLVLPLPPDAERFCVVLVSGPVVHLGDAVPDTNDSVQSSHTALPLPPSLSRLSHSLCASFTQQHPTNRPIHIRPDNPQTKTNRTQPPCRAGDSVGLPERIP